MIAMEALATSELISRPVCQARVQPDVLLVVGEAPKGDSQLKLFGHGWIEVLDQLERDVRRNTFRR